MRRWWPMLVLGGWLTALAGCGDPPPKPLTPDEERQFEQQRQEVRQKGKRAAPSTGRTGHSRRPRSPPSRRPARAPDRMRPVGSLTGMKRISLLRADEL